MPSETHHAVAKNFFLQHSSARWIILSTVFDETVTWLRVRCSIQASITIGKTLRRDHHYVSLSTTEDQATWEAFCQYDDKFWSYTDCSLLIMASRLKVPYVVAFDEHIRQMSGLGIIRLP